MRAFSKRANVASKIAVFMSNRLQVGAIDLQPPWIWRAVMLALYVSPSKPVAPSIGLETLGSEAESTEAGLAKGLAEADAGAYQVVWRRFHPVVSSMVRRRLRDPGETEDLVQEVFLAVFRAAHALRDPMALRAFVLTITARMLNRKLKKRRADLQLMFATQAQMENLPGMTADTTAKHAVAGLGRLMSRLRTREREAFLLHFVGGLDATDVARRLGVSTPTARRSLSRARRYVRLWASRDPFLSDYVKLRLH
jgi:RNA polymerase sigma-70 factor (ECF subfamily)